METIEAISKVVAASGKTKRTISVEMKRSGNYLASVMEQSRRKGGGANSATLAGIAQACGYVLAMVPADKVDGSMLVIDPPERG